MNLLGDIVGPSTLPCEQECEVPAGVTMHGLPMPRHVWPGILVCPNGCGRAWEAFETEVADERRDEAGAAT